MRLCGVGCSLALPFDWLVCAVIDWQRGWCKTVGTNDLGRLSDAQWLLAWVNQGLKEMQETGMLDPLCHSLDLVYATPMPPPPPSGGSLYSSSAIMSRSNLDQGSTLCHGPVSCRIEHGSSFVIKVARLAHALHTDEA